MRSVSIYIPNYSICLYLHLDLLQQLTGSAFVVFLCKRSETNLITALGRVNTQNESSLLVSMFRETNKRENKSCDE